MITENISLKPFNTFGIDVKAKYFAPFNSINVLGELLEHKSMLTTSCPLLILGGGSNILFTKNFDGIVLKNEIKGIELISEDENHYYVKAFGGENWNDFVMFCIKNNYAGIENLSLIPGCVGASPMQNIGAYGVEIKDVFHQLEAYHLQEKNVIIFTKNECDFGYRESVFKNKLKGQFIILSVTFKLNKKPNFNINYGAISQELEKMGAKELSIKIISDAVINIRNSKLPNPKDIGNAGSFFKNPTILTQQFETLKKEFPEIIGYPLENKEYTKLAAGWLIEQCGWKGFRQGDAGVHAKQALVLVNFGRAKGNEIFALSTKIIESVNTKFGVELEREVNIF